MRKLSAKWIPKCLNVDQRRERCQSSEQSLEMFRLDRNDFLSRLMTMEETWLYHHAPETKQQTMEWRHSVSPRPQKILSVKVRWKFLASIFWDQDGILLINYLPKGQTIKAEHYSSLLVQLKDFCRKNATGREVHQGCLVLARKCPGSPGTCKPEQPGLPEIPGSSSPTLFSGSGPVGLQPVLRTETAIESSTFFFRRGSHCCCGDLVGRKTF